MQLYWSKYGIPHGYLDETPIHLIYRLKDCLPVGPLRMILADCREQLRVLRISAVVDPQSSDIIRIETVLENYLRAYDELLDA